MTRILISSFAAFLIMHLVSKMTASLPYIASAAIIALIVFLVLLMSYRWITEARGKLSGIGLGKIDIAAIAPGIIMSVVLLLTFPLIGYALDVRMVLADEWALNVVAIFLTGGLAEELLFRGFVYGQLSLRMPRHKAFWLSTTFFALTHLLLFTYLDASIALLSTILAVTSSLSFIYLYERGKRTIWSSALVHTIIRTIGLVITTDAEDKYLLVSLCWLVACMVVPYIVLLFYNDFRTQWSNKK